MGSVLRLGFSPWPEDFHMLWVRPLKKKKKDKIVNMFKYILCFKISANDKMTKKLSIQEMKTGSKLLVGIKKWVS